MLLLIKILFPNIHLILQKIYILLFNLFLSSYHFRSHLVLNILIILQIEKFYRILFISNIQFAFNFALIW